MKYGQLFFALTSKYNIGVDPSLVLDDQWEIMLGKNYRWKDWRIIKSRDSFFIWCDAVAVEFRYPCFYVKNSIMSLLIPSYIFLSVRYLSHLVL